MAGRFAFGDKMADEQQQAIQFDDEERDRLTSSLIQDINTGYAGMAERREAAAECRRLLRYAQPRENPPWPGASEVVVPVVKSTLLALKSYLIPTLLNPSPMMHHEGCTVRGKQFADDLDEFIDAQGKRYDPVRNTLVRWIIAALIDSQSTLHQYYRTETRTVKKYERDPSTGDIQLDERLETVYDAPAVEIIPLDRFFTFPVANVDVDDSPGCGHRGAMTGAQLLEMVRAGEMDDDAVRHIMHTGGDSESTKTPSGEMREIDDSEQQSNTQKFHSSTFTITEVYYRYTQDDESDKPEEDYRFFLHEPSNTMLGGKPSPWFHGMRPYTQVAPYPDPEGTSGDTLAETGAGHMQVSQTGLVRMAFDGTSIGILPPSFIGTSMGNSLAHLKKNRVPGGFITVNDSYFEAGGQHIQPFQTGSVNPASLFPLLDKLDTINEFATGSIDDMKQLGGQGGMTVPGALQIAESSQKRIAFLVDNFAAALVRYGKITLALNYQFQGNHGPLQLWAELHEQDPHTSQPQPTQPGQPVEAPQPPPPPPPTLFDVLNEQYTITSSGVRDTQNRAILAMRGDDLFKLLSNDQTVWSDPAQRWTVMRYVLHAKGIPDPERYLRSQDQYVEADGKSKQLQMEMMQAEAQMHSIGITRQPEPPKSPQAIMDEAEMKALGEAFGKALGPELAAQMAGKLPSILPGVTQGEAALLEAAFGQSPQAPGQPGQPQGQSPVPQQSGGMGTMNG